MKTKKITLSALLIALGVVGGSFFIPVGVSKCAPVQHIINVICAVTLGPAYGVAVAFCISLLRNIMGTGSLLAFPGSMIGAFIAGIVYKKTKKDILTVVGEVFGTGVLGGLLAFPIAKFIIGKKVAAFFFIPPFLISTIGGSIIAYIIIKAFNFTRIKLFTEES